MARGGIVTALMLVAVVLVVTKVMGTIGEAVDYSYEEDPTYWHNVAQAEMEEALKDRGRGVAKNVILFLGDGMGVSTVTAARILEGQRHGRKGEEVMLSFDRFPYTGLSKTYNTNYQVTDSAASGTAYLTGVKTNQGTLGINAKATRGDCESATGKEVTSILRWSRLAGKSVGVVTTTRITHATPAAAFSHCPERNWESDAKIPEAERACKDIAAQLIDDNSDINVILGGGRDSFYPTHENSTSSRNRKDGRNLITEWETKMAQQNKKYKYVNDRAGLEAVDPLKTDFLLGLFTESHLAYEQQRDKTLEPSLAEMTSKAIQILKKNENGFFLLVEAGRIDHGHHATMPSLALHDTIALSQAVDRAIKLTSASDTLTVVTADHSHVFTFAGYSGRGNDILGLNRGTDHSLRLAADQMPYTTLLYGNGPGFTAVRENLTEVDTAHEEYKSQTAVPLSSETHAGEDVAIYAHGPQSFLYSGVHEQNYIPMVMAYASCVGPYAEGESHKCAKHETSVVPQPPQRPDGVCDSGVTSSLSFSLAFVCVVVTSLLR